jgi:hypothetical protein
MLPESVRPRVTPHRPTPMCHSLLQRAARVGTHHRITAVIIERFVPSARSPMVDRPTHPPTPHPCPASVQVGDFFDSDDSEESADGVRATYTRRGPALLAHDARFDAHHLARAHAQHHVTLVVLHPLIICTRC